MAMENNALVQLQVFHDALVRFEDGSISASALNEQARTAQALLKALPERYDQVLLSLLDRLESAALFTEESCSFSHTTLLEHLHGWVAKAREQLSQ